MLMNVPPTAAKIIFRKSLNKRTVATIYFIALPHMPCMKTRILRY